MGAAIITSVPATRRRQVSIEARFYVRDNDGGEQDHPRAADDRPPGDVGTT